MDNSFARELLNTNGYLGHRRLWGKAGTRDVSANEYLTAQQGRKPADDALCASLVHLRGLRTGSNAESQSDIEDGKRGQKAW